MTQAHLKSPDTSALDALTRGAFSAPTSGERASRVRDWLASQPASEQMQEVYRELSGRDKGAARLVRERLEEIKRSKGQEAMAAEWAEKGRGLLGQPKLNIADAMAWQRDAAKAGAPLSREPLASVKIQLAERVKAIEDLQHRVQVQREAAVLLAQRIEVLSTKPYKDGQAAAEALSADVPAWQSQAEVLSADPNWPSVDARFQSLLNASRAQLQVVWDAFQAALAQAAAAASDPAAPLPPVPVWADELRALRGIPAEAPVKGPRPKLDPEARARASLVVSEAVARLEQEMAQGHGKATAGAASALRNALKEQGKLVDPSLEQQAHAALAAAGQLEGWQRWSADQQRQDLIARAEALFERPAPVEGEAPTPPKPRLGGRKMQETLRLLREQWKQADQAGPPNHALWKRFDEACNEAHKVVEAWLDKVKADAAQHKAQRLALIEEVRSWAADNSTARDGDWKGFARVLQQFENRWREAGHLNEKAFAELQPLWKEAIQSAAAPLVALQKQSLERRHAMIEEARELGAAPQLRIDAVKALQQRWQQEAQAVPLDRKQEQKLWDAFRKPIDDAFNRKSEEREKAAAQLSERDRVVLEASRALEAANASGDAARIRAAIAALDAALRGQAQAAAAVAKADEAAATMQPPGGDAAVPAADPPAGAEGSGGGVATAEVNGADAAVAVPVPAAPSRPVAKPVIAMRGDDRPGMKKAVQEPGGRGGKFGDRKPGGGGMFGDRHAGGPREGRGARFSERDQEDRGPRLGDVAFRAQRDALEHAQSTLKKLAAQAHGEALTQLMTAWEQRSPEQVPSQSELGKAVSAPVRTRWVQAIGAEPQGEAAEAMLRLEIATELPTPAEHLNARRALQLKLLTRRNDPSPAQTWGEDTARVLATRFDAQLARRL